MSDRRRCQPHPFSGRSPASPPPGRHGGQALAEYVLILALVAIALIAVLTITGPAVGNVFSNAVYNLLGGTIVPRETLPADDFWTQVAAVASYTPENGDRRADGTTGANGTAGADGAARANRDRRADRTAGANPAPADAGSGVRLPVRRSGERSGPVGA